MKSSLGITKVEAAASKCSEEQLGREDFTKATAAANNDKKSGIGRSIDLNPQRRPKNNEATAEEDAVEVPVEDQERQVRDSNMIKLVNGNDLNYNI